MKTVLLGLLSVISLAACQSETQTKNNPNKDVFSETEKPSVKNTDHDPSGNAMTRGIHILDQEALEILNPENSIELLADGYQWTEGPVWVEEGGYLLFSDIPNNRIHRYQPGQGVDLWLEPAGGTGLVAGDDESGSNGLLVDGDGKLLLMQHGDRRVARMKTLMSDPQPAFESLAAEFEGKRLNSPNDGVLHSDGSLYFTDPPYGLKEGMTDKRKQLAYQGLYRLSPDGDLQLLDDSVNYPNGIALSINEDTLFVAVSDKQQPRWLAYDVQLDGSITNKRIYFDASYLKGKENYQGMPDGMAVHSKGYLFATGPGGVWVFAEDGRILAQIMTGRLTANCALSADEKALYITAHDSLLRLALN